MFASGDMHLLSYENIVFLLFSLISGLSEISNGTTDTIVLDIESIDLDQKYIDIDEKIKKIQKVVEKLQTGFQFFLNLKGKIKILFVLS